MKFFYRLWNSPTFTTWGSFASNSLFAIILLPLITTKFSQQEIAIWLLLNIFIGFQGLADLGFGVTFIRTISYSLGGITKIKNFQNNDKIERQDSPNWELIDQIYGTASRLFLFLSILFFLIFTIIGFYSLKNPISYSSDQSNAWISFVIIMLVTFIRLNGNKYSIFLQGVNQIALLRRWETFFSLTSIVVIFIVLQFTNSILYLIIAQQLFVLFAVMRNKILTGNFNNKIVQTFKQKSINKEIFKSLFPSAWRSWVGVLMSYGLIQVSGIIVCQSSNSQLSSSYLFSIKILDIIKNFSNAPFYSKIPILSRLFAENNTKQLLKVAQRGIKLSLLLFVTGAIGVAFFGNYFLELIDSNVSLSSGLILPILILAYYLERYGALHIQLYSLSNNIVWHIANGISGTIFISISLILINYTDLGIVSYPIGLLMGYLFFYSWYCALHSYKFFKLNFIDFEYKTALIPHLSILIYIIITLIKL